MDESRAINTEIGRTLPRLRNSLGYLALTVWAVLMLIIVASLMAGHWIQLPKPQSGDVSPISLADHKPHGWIAIHFLYGDCPCSQRILKRVISRQPLEQVDERIVLIGRDEPREQAALELGFEVDRITPELLQSKYGVSAAPLLLIVDSAGVIRYSGGYTSRKQGLDIQDTEIIERVVSGESVAELPLYGCAVSDELKAIIDPLGLK